ncbi:hypothetical protein TRFO_29642 [Tritrichomonas foetus]|uniref:Myb-like domain-containing protein n=1 Tax=Tritrichomonas foetus TaxID=1144522 RepID=A0A1J4JWE6_9EUKA|nr:hypothetical protein TRFO_29642 [Tritrichomonas foetus]|eukprot:OHT03034.1 hypothetical protein TRFO_29642 [Tritrichomonas foetus]
MSTSRKIQFLSGLLLYSKSIYRPIISMKSQHQEQEVEEEGILVTIYTNKALRIEKEMFRRLCMKYGPKWNLMHCLMPWRTKANWRSTWMHITKQAAVSEWTGVCHDPLEVRKVYKPMCHKGFENDKLIFRKKLVNKNDMITKEERNKSRLQNETQFGIPDEKVKEIDFQFGVNTDYVIEALRKRKVFLIIRLRQLKLEKARRMNENPPKENLGVLVGKDRKMKPGKRRTKTNYSRETSDILFDVPNFNNLE